VGTAAAATPRVQSVVKVFGLIETMVELGEATVGELADALGEPRSSVYRMVATLQQLELVEPGARRGVFRPGIGLVRLGGTVLARFDERRVATPVLERLRRETRETVHLGVRRGYQCVFIERLHGERLHSLAIPLGGVLPLHVGASPRALLAYEPRSFWDEYFAQATLEPATPKSPREEPALRALLEEILETGISISDEDVVLGVATIAAPVFDHRGKVRAAIALNLLPDVLHAERERYAALVRAASVDVSQAFGFDPRATALS
jgi:DNA-binding IclR family transcriptional regulator